MKTEKIIYNSNLIIVKALLFGQTGNSFELNLALDTGSTQTIIRPSYFTALAYKLSEGKNLTVTTGTKNERAVEIQVNKFSVFGIETKNLQTVAKDLPTGLFFIDGLLGLDFFQKTRKTLCLDFNDKEITIK